DAPPRVADRNADNVIDGRGDAGLADEHPRSLDDRDRVVTSGIAERALHVAHDRTLVEPRDHGVDPCARELRAGHLVVDGHVGPLREDRRAQADARIADPRALRRVAGAMLRAERAAHFPVLTNTSARSSTSSLPARRPRSVGRTVMVGCTPTF